MVDSMRFMDWIEMARKDLRGAKILFEHSADNYLVCFHCQQAIEKYLKGFLLKNNSQLVEGHGLVKLCKLCELYNPGFKCFLKEVAFVNEYYLETRYPADQPLIVTEEDTQECLAITEKLFDFIDKIIF